MGDEVVLKFQLEQDIDALNNDKSLVIANDKKAYDNLLYKDETAFGRGALIIRKTDAYQNKKVTNTEIVMNKNINIQIINVYRIINEELNNWRDIMLKI